MLTLIFAGLIASIAAGLAAWRFTANNNPRAVKVRIPVEHILRKKP
ncbi:MAG TPA: hypothetical protein VLS48_02835 [Anaerolineales bacterium]|nr:hypothetical protein [Anaerolineales bacterium]